MKRESPFMVNINPSMISSAIADDLTYMRWLLKITQRELAAASEVTPQTIRNWELDLHDSKRREEVIDNLKHLIKYLKYGEPLSQQTLEWTQKFNPPLLERTRTKELKSKLDTTNGFWAPCSQ